MGLSGLVYKEFAGSFFPRSSDFGILGHCGQELMVLPVVFVVRSVGGWRTCGLGFGFRVLGFWGLGFGV